MAKCKAITGLAVKGLRLGTVHINHLFFGAIAVPLIRMRGRDTNFRPMLIDYSRTRASKKPDRPSVPGPVNVIVPNVQKCI